MHLQQVKSQDKNSAQSEVRYLVSAQHEAESSPEPSNIHSRSVETRQMDKSKEVDSNFLKEILVLTKQNLKTKTDRERERGREGIDGDVR